FILNKILENSKGSVFYVDQAINYLVENGYLVQKGNILNISSSVIVPVTGSINDLIKRRITGLEKYTNLYGSYIKLLMAGDEIEYNIANLLIKNNLKNVLNRLTNMDLIETDNVSYVKLKHYNIIYNAVFPHINDEKKAALSKEILDDLNLMNEHILHPLKNKLLTFCDLQLAIKNLNLWADKCLLIGDVSCFIDCMEEVLKLTEIHSMEKQNSNTETTLNNLKLSIYEQLGELSYELYPDLAFRFLLYSLNNMDVYTQKDKFINLCIIMVKCCNSIGNYDETLLYIGKLIKSVPPEIFDIKSKKFNLKYYLLNFIKIRALFNAGKLLQCVELCNEFIFALNMVKEKKMLDEKFKEDFLSDFQADAALFLIKSRILLLSLDSDESIESISKYLPDPSLLEITKLLVDTLKGSKNVNPAIILEKYKDKKLSDDSQALICIINLIYLVQQDKWGSIPDVAYKGRLFAEKSNDFQLWYFFELVIGLAYQQNKNYKRAKAIYKNVLEEAVDKSMLNIILVSQYLLASVELFDNNLEKAIEIAYSANVFIEREQETSKLFSLNFKYLLALAFSNNQDFDNSIVCAKQSLYIAETHGLLYNKTLVSLLLYQIFDYISKTNEEKAAFYKEDFEKLKHNLSHYIEELDNNYLLNRFKQLIKSV
ncbi:MAG: hypothetical protein WC197_08480, partial [Candidatus Gastranaerophilaceae bacterium]